MKCPECRKKMDWQEGLLPVDGGIRDMTKGRHYCSPCRLHIKDTESRGTQKGRKMAHDLVGVHFMDKKITSHSVATQIGIFRERQHCATCHNNAGDPCTCKNCDCLYCREHK